MYCTHERPPRGFVETTPLWRIWKGTPARAGREVPANSQNAENGKRRQGVGWSGKTKESSSEHLKTSGKGYGTYNTVAHLVSSQFIALALSEAWTALMVYISARVEDQHQSSSDQLVLVVNIAVDGLNRNHHFALLSLLQAHLQ